MLRTFMTLMLGALLLAPAPARAIQGCTLNNPDRDIRRLFPQATDYRTHYIALSDRGGQADLKWLAERLGDKPDPVYEAADIPYTYYEVLKGKLLIGYVFGVNQRGRYGGMQLILATDLIGRIKAFYFQKLSNPARAAFKSPSFTDGFSGLSLTDFYFHQGYMDMGLKHPDDKVARLKPPASSDAAEQDFRSALRGVKKALILFDHFWMKDRTEPTFQKVRSIVRSTKEKKK